MTEERPPDYAPNEESGRPLEQHLKSRSTWLRLFFMIVVGILYAVSRLIVTVVVVVQFFHVLFTGETNPRLLELGRSLATYTYQIVDYLTFNTEVRPFPFDAEWPTSPLQ
jgi:hypothetical protein